METEMSKTHLSTPFGTDLARRGRSAFERVASTVATPASPSAGPTPIRERQRPVNELPGHEALANLLP